MNFRIAARTILHLGAELISSDGIALYELIKNAYDAGSPRVRIDVVRSLHRRAQREVLGSAHRHEDLEQLRAICLESLDLTSPKARQLEEELRGCDGLDDLIKIVQSANQIRITDTGKGMTSDELHDAFLTIGTRSKRRLIESDVEPEGRRQLGEKGIGRLSAMRLGSKLQIETASASETLSSSLEIDWDAFSHESEAMLEDIPIKPISNAPKVLAETHGTAVTIKGLRRDWSETYLSEIVSKDLARMTDPFETSRIFSITITHNGTVLIIPKIEPWIFKHAHATCKGSFDRITIEEDGKERISYRLSGKLVYGVKEEAFNYDELDLVSITSAPSRELLESLGIFNFELYWFNRRILTKLEGIGTLQEVRASVQLWAGGLMLFRDGFRVLPYGGENDDWLGIDVRSFGASGFKLNRRQIIGRVRITSRGNHNLTDQANREGLVDNEESRALVKMLETVLEQQMRRFINRIDKENKESSALPGGDVLEQRLKLEEERLTRNVGELIRYAQLDPESRHAIHEVRRNLTELTALIGNVREVTKSYERGKSELLNLAAVGLLVEVMAHELNRTASGALITLGGMSSEERTGKLTTTINVLTSQLKAIQRRLRVLDPMSTATRNVKEKIDVVALLEDFRDFHSEQFSREGIECTVSVLPHRDSRLVITAVRGMIFQILENLLSNSVYWLNQAKKLEPKLSSKVEITLDTSLREITFSDSGQGISTDDRNRVFEAFWTKRPAGGGKGLGLYISREIARYHGAEMYLNGDQDGRLRTFVIDLRNVK